MSSAAATAHETTTETGFVHGYPSPETSRRARDDADYQRAVVAYRFWYPTVSVEGIFNGSREAGIEDGKAFGIAAAGPKQVGFTLNSDTPYGSGVLDLSDGPMVIELPPGPYIGLADDHNQSWILDMGLPGPDEAKGGKHLVLPPGYDGDVPDGFHVGRSQTLKVMFALRALPQNGDVPKAMDALRAVKVYPLAQPANTLTPVDTTETTMDSTSLRWEDNLQFWQVLKRIIDAEPLVPAFEPMYGLLEAIGIRKGQSFEPDARMTAILVRAAKAGREQMLVAAFDSNREDRIVWPDRRWEWLGLVPGSVQFETPSGIDLEARDRWFAQAIVTSPAMFRRTPGAGSLYWAAFRDADGEFLDGGNTYRLTLPQPVPGKLFYSVTVYDAETRSEVQTAQGRAALRSLFELKDADQSKPLDLYFGPMAPKGEEQRWIQTTAGRGWFPYIRIYGPEKAAFDGAWRPSDIKQIK